MRRMVAYSLAIVRLILVPVIVLSIYYIFRMGFIVDRIVSVDAPAATLAQQASIQMLETRRDERNYLLLRERPYFDSFQAAVARVGETLQAINKLDRGDKIATDRLYSSLAEYQQTFSTVVAATSQPAMTSSDRIRTVVRAYEKDLNNLISSSKKRGRTRLMEDLRKRVDSFDTQISETVQQDSPALRSITDKLQFSSDSFLAAANQVERDNWSRVEADRAEAKRLLRQAEWALTLVSCVTLFFSVWVSFSLPRQVVKPLTSLREAIDHAAQGNYELEFDIQGKGEVVDVARSLQRLLAAVHPVVARE
jgi:CHASE3 domain sensor protein